MAEGQSPPAAKNFTNLSSVMKLLSVRIRTDKELPGSGLPATGRTRSEYPIGTS
jgi:hypothetical protein